MSAVEVAGIFKHYDTAGEITEVLKGLDLVAEEGEMIMIMGPSGSGKTTLLNILGGIDDTNKGGIKVAGEDLTKMKKKDLNRFRREKVGFIFQFYNLIPTLTARENIELGLEMMASDKKEMRGLAEKYLKLVGLDDKMDRFPQELSGGEQQRVAIARALAKEPKIILADEPTGNLDEEREESVMTLMKKLKDELKITFVIVSHNSRLKQYMDKTYDLRKGKLAEMVAAEN
jgi:putative ABC transport system ATP-binding protein